MRRDQKWGVIKIALLVLVLFSVLGVLVVLYCFHFRYRALVMGPERLRNALSRTVSGEENASDEDLLYGLDELGSRLHRGLVLTSLALAMILISCITLVALSTLPELSLALSGLCIFMVAIIVSLILLRDIPRFLRSHLLETLEEKEDGNDGSGS
jgi:hypothetical protein